MNEIQQQRKNFERWYIQGVRDSNPRFSDWNDPEIKHGCMAPDGSGSYKVESARLQWSAWQAAIQSHNAFYVSGDEVMSFTLG